MSEPVLVRAARLAAEGEPYVLATVVNVERPASTRRGDRALITPDGELFGWVGGACPAARTLRVLAGTIGWRVSDRLVGRADAVVVASMGHGDEDALAAVLGTETGYVGLVASARRARAVLAELRARGLDEEVLACLRSPAGLDLGPSSQEEIAVAILAELVAWRHTRGVSPAEAVEEAVDPICGMTVSIAGARETVVRDGATYYFCGPGCRRRFEAARV